MAAGERNAFALKFVALQTICKGMLLLVSYRRLQGFPGALDGTESACNAGDLDLISELGKYPVEAMATHSTILVWRIPCTEEPGGLQSIGSQTVGHD